MAEINASDKRFVVTFPLITEPWQEDRIDKMMRLMTVLYNDKQEVLLRRYIHLSRSSKFKEAQTAGVATFKRFMQDNGFSKFNVEKVFADSSRSSSETNKQLLAHGLNSDIIQELSHRSWSAWEKKLFGNGKHVASKRDGDNKPIVNCLKSRAHKGVVTGFHYSKEDYTITMSASIPKKHIIFTIPFKVNRNSEYEVFALNQDVRNIAIVRNEIRGKNKYYVQFTFAGTPYNKGRKLGTGVVGIDPGPGKIAVVSDEVVSVIPLAEAIVQDERKVRLLQRKLDRSRRANNPDEYNEDGTVKKQKHNWVNSSNYIKTKNELSNTQRKLAAKRKIAHNELANQLLALGNEFHVEDNSFKTWQARAKETSYDKKGRCRAKGRYGKTIGKCAPSEFFTILENKVKNLSDGVYVDIPETTACTAFDFTNGEFTKHPTTERTIITSDGFKHDRDAIAAFNMKFVKKEMVAGKKKIKKSEANFDTKAMSEFYPKFCSLEKKLEKEDL